MSRAKALLTLRKKMNRINTQERVSDIPKSFVRKGHLDTKECHAKFKEQLIYDNHQVHYYWSADTPEFTSKNSHKQTNKKYRK